MYGLVHDSRYLWAFPCKTEEVRAVAWLAGQWTFPFGICYAVTSDSGGWWWSHFDKFLRCVLGIHFALCCPYRGLIISSGTLQRNTRSWRASCLRNYTPAIKETSFSPRPCVQYYINCVNNAEMASTLSIYRSFPSTMLFGIYLKNPLEGGRPADTPEDNHFPTGWTFLRLHAILGWPCCATFWCDRGWDLWKATFISEPRYSGTRRLGHVLALVRLIVLPIFRLLINVFFFYICVWLVLYLIALTLYCCVLGLVWICV